MMGSLPAQQNSLFYDFCLERHISENHLLRHIDRFLDFDRIREHLEPYYSHTGRPSIDPELMIRMLLVGYCYGIRSERRLCEEVNYNLAYRWFCRLGLEDKIPNHSTFSKNRHGRFRESDLFRSVFNMVVRKCVDAGLVKGEGFATDASFVGADVNRQRAIDNTSESGWLPDRVESRPVREYLEALEENSDYRRPQKSISLTDPMAQWTAAKGPALFAYSTNYMIDIDSNIIVDVEASPSTNLLEVKATQVMIERIEKNHGIIPKRLMADTVYGSAHNLNFLVKEKNIEPHIPIWDKSQRTDGSFSACNFIWNEELDRYECPTGKLLLRSRRPFKSPRTGITKEGTIIYRASKSDCDLCELKSHCCPNTPSRKIKRSIFEDVRDMVRKINQSAVFDKSLRERKKVEMSFAHMKRNLNLVRLRLRGLNGANDEFVMTALAQNLRRMATIFGQRENC